MKINNLRKIIYKKMKIKFVNLQEKDVNDKKINYWSNIQMDKEYEVISDYEKKNLGHFFLISNLGKFQEVPVDEHIIKIS